MSSAIVRAVLVLGVSLLLGTAQLSAGQAQKPAEPQKKGGGSHSMTGCLQKGTDANTWTLTNVEKVKTVEIVEVASGVNLAPHVGHKITITGTTVPAAKEGAAKGGGHRMKIDQVKMVSAACP
jgi:hypothetical protein